MFTLGNKELVVNSTRKPAATTTGTVLKIKGYGDFDSANVVTSSVLELEYTPALFAGGAFICPTAAVLGIPSGKKGASVTFTIDVLSSRHGAAESRDFVRFGDPIVIEFLVDDTYSGTEVMQSLEDAMSAYEEKYKTTDYYGGSLPFTWGEAIDENQVLWLAAKEGYLGFQTYVTFYTKWAPSLYETPFYSIDGTTTPNGYLDNPLAITTLQVDVTIGDTVITVGSGQLLVEGSVIELNDDPGVYYVVTKITANGATWKDLTLDRPAEKTIAILTDDEVNLVFSGGSMGLENNVDGKYLEENVRMDTKHTNDAYSISPDERPLIGVPYLTISWESIAPTGGPDSWLGHNRLQTFAVDAETGTQTMKYTLYMNKLAFGTIADAVGDDTGNLLEQLVDWLP